MPISDDELMNKLKHLLDDRMPASPRELLDDPAFVRELEEFRAAVRDPIREESRASFLAAIRGELASPRWSDDPRFACIFEKFNEVFQSWKLTNVHYDLKGGEPLKARLTYVLHCLRCGGERIELIVWCKDPEHETFDFFVAHGCLACSYIWRPGDLCNVDLVLGE